MEGNDIAQGKEINLRFFVRAGDYGRTGRRQMSRLIEDQKDLTKRNHLVRAIQQTLMNPSRTSKAALQLLGRHMAQVHIELHLSSDSAPP